MRKPAGPIFDYVKADLDRLTSEFLRAVSFEPGEAPSYRSIPAWVRLTADGRLCLDR